jgi:hypothetical protein
MLRRTGVRRATALLCCLSGVTACAAVPHQPPGRPPTPATVTRAEPGGDAADPHEAALRRQITLGWARAADKDHQVEVPLPDTLHWKRVRYRGIPHFLGFRYGKEHHVMVLAFVVDMPDGAPVTGERCLRRFETQARPQIKTWDVKLQPMEVSTTEWDGQRLPVHMVEGEVVSLLSRKEFSAAWVAYPAYPDACLVLGVAAQWQGHADLARQVRARFVEQGFPETVILTPNKPFRHGV